MASDAEARLREARDGLIGKVDFLLDGLDTAVTLRSILTRYIDDTFSTLNDTAPLDDLGAAWRAAEEALPEGWYIGVQTGNRDAAFVAIAADMFWLTDSLTGIFADGDTPAAALRALASRLEAR